MATGETYTVGANFKDRKFSLINKTMRNWNSELVSMLNLWIEPKERYIIHLLA